MGKSLGRVDLWMDVAQSTWDVTHSTWDFWKKMTLDRLVGSDGCLGVIQTDVELVTTKPGWKNIEASRNCSACFVESDGRKQRRLESR